MFMRRLLLVVLLALPLRGAEDATADAEKKARADRIAAEVQRRAELRNAAAAAEENARRVVEEHESGEKPASAEELAAARAVIRQADERRAKEKKATGVRLSMPDADMATVAAACRQLLGRNVTVSDRAKSKFVTVKFSASSPEEARTMLETALRENGLYLIPRAEDLLLDTEPAGKENK
jgi:hypothetical protein